MGRHALVLGLFSGLWFAVSAQTATAQNSSVLAAESKFSEGVQMMKEGRCEEALPSFRASQSLDPASGTLLDIGYCEANLGHTASAWFAYRLALRLAQSSSRPQHEQIARQEIARLEPELSYLTLVVPHGAAGVAVELDGAVVEPAVWAIAMPVDPGKHEVRVLVAGEPRWNQSISIDARQRSTLEIPQSSIESTRPMPGDRPQEAAPISGNTYFDASLPARSSTVKGVTYATAALGTIGISVATVLLVSARHDYDAVDADCPGNRCQSTTSYDQRNAAIRRFHWSLGVAGIGGALLGTAATVWFAAKPVKRDAHTGRIGLDLERNLLGVSWRTSF